jgi:hypothetical protein
MKFREWLHWFWLHLQGEHVAARIYALDHDDRCQCPCGCKNKRDGLEDLCHYCMETHEDLRRPEWSE